MARPELNWSDLKYFLVVARLGSLAKAAERLQVTHSTVFRRVNNLEAAMGVKLFARHPEGYRLTDTGMAVQSHVEQVADRIDELQRFLDNQHDQLSGVINVTAPHNLAYRFLPPLLREFQAQYPDIQINLLASNDDLNLSRREADLAIRATSAPPEHLVGQELLSLAWGLYAAPSYLEKRGRPSSLDMLAEHRLLSTRLDQLRLPAFDWLERNSSPDQIVARANDLMALAALATAGLGIAPLPDDQARPELERLFTFDPGQHSTLWLLTHPDLRDSRRLQVFKHFLTKQLPVALKMCPIPP